MLRLCEVHEPLEAALGVLHNPVEGITSADTSFGIVQVEVRGSSCVRVELGNSWEIMLTSSRFDHISSVILTNYTSIISITSFDFCFQHIDQFQLENVYKIQLKHTDELPVKNLNSLQCHSCISAQCPVSSSKGKTTWRC